MKKFGTYIITSNDLAVFDEVLFSVKSNEAFSVVNDDITFCQTYNFIQSLNKLKVGDNIILEKNGQKLENVLTFYQEHCISNPIIMQQLENIVNSAIVQKIEKSSSRGIF